MTDIYPGEPPPISEKVVAEIGLLSKIAEAHGSLVTLRDIVALTHIDLTEEQIERQWQAVPDLAGRFELKAGFVHEREAQDGSNSHAHLGTEKERRARAKSFLAFANAFTVLRREKEATIVAVSGSTSYQSASETDDLDFLVVTKSGFLWTFLVKSMLLSRAFRLLKRGAPRICFSYAVDEPYANREFTSSKDPLFARDALTAVVVQGTESYQRLLSKSSWMAEYYPRLFNERARRKVEEGPDNSSTLSPFRKFLNQMACFVVGKYIATKSEMLNRKFRKQGKSDSLFALNIGPDHFVVESDRYSRLRSMYNALNKTAQT